ncbi:hypothetical protein [Streptomyces yunnanensis]|uniref:Fibronectin type III domain-containing protein n=1 Tax=Streptomyces yunnanensis TaxID=156453 RepID=A0A9X8N7X1_9ACTN|nr:hypothetical protein [Streptomyces yunnanensis]SHN24875.1 hypothetical protein SAMN05216268_126148 [Streptomyces yunnanensis]
MTNSAQVHDGADWRTPVAYEVFDGTAWKRVAKKEVHDGTKWIEVFADNPTPVLEKPGRVPAPRLSQVNQDSKVYIKAEWEAPPSGGKPDRYTIRWGHAKGSWIDGGESIVRTKLILVESPLWDHAEGPKYQLRVRAHNASGQADAESPDGWITLVKPVEKIPAPAEVQVWREGGEWNEVHVFWTPVTGHEDYTIRVWHQGKVVNTVDTTGLPVNDAGYRQQYVAPVPTPQWGQVFDYEVSVKGADSWSGRVEHKWAGYSVGAPGKPKVSIRQVWWPEEEKGNHLDIEWAAPGTDPDHAFYRVEWFATGSNGTQTSGTINTTSTKTSLHLTDAVVGPVKGSNVSFKALAHSTNEDHSEDFATSVESDMTTPTWLA